LPISDCRLIAVNRRAFSIGNRQSAIGNYTGESMPTTLVNPLDETPRIVSNPAPRLTSLAGKTIGLLDISKGGGSVFLDHLERLLKQRYGVASIVRAMKPTFTKPAPDAVIEMLVAANCDAVIEALAD
jgi:hypothetical protein